MNHQRLGYSYKILQQRYDFRNSMGKRLLVIVRTSLVVVVLVFIFGVLKPSVFSML